MYFKFRSIRKLIIRFSRSAIILHSKWFRSSRRFEGILILVHTKIFEVSEGLSFFIETLDQEWRVFETFFFHNLFWVESFYFFLLLINETLLHNNFALQNFIFMQKLFSFFLVNMILLFLNQFKKTFYLCFHWFDAFIPLSYFFFLVVK